MSRPDTKYFPAVCSSAHRPFLSPLVGPNGEALSPRCPSCGSAARIISGAWYGTADCERFERAVDAIEAHRLLPDEARTALRILPVLARKPAAELRDGLFALLKVESLADFAASDRDELVAFVSVLSGVLSVQSEFTGPTRGTHRRNAGVQSDGDPASDQPPGER